MSDTIIVILVASAAGALFGPPGYALGRWLERRYWPRKPPAPPTARMQLRGIKLPCPNCGKEIGADIEIEGPFPPSNDPAALKAAGWEPDPDPFPMRDPLAPMPLGERLLAEKAALMARLDATTETEARRRVLTRVAAIDRELGRFN